MNPFNVLCDESDESDDESNDDDQICESISKIEDSKSICPPNRQAGGNIPIRYDPNVGILPQHRNVSSNNASFAEEDSSLDISSAELLACCKVIKILGEKPALFKLAQFKPLRAALHPLILEQMKNYDTKNSNKDNNNSKNNIKRKRNIRDIEHTNDANEVLAQMEKEYINRTQLRAIRFQQLERLNTEYSDKNIDGGLHLNVPRIPDGVAIPSSSSSSSTANHILSIKNNGENTLSEPSKSEEHEDHNILLRNPISCYICRKPYLKLHFFYHQLCPECAEFNYYKRNEVTDMTGKVCLVTGGRTKIGYQTVLKLLRCKACVIVTTRFPSDATERYRGEVDWNQWSSKLHIYGLDFRDLGNLETFCSFISETYERLDAIVNNAAQTVRRPAAYYAHLVEKERMQQGQKHEESQDNSSDHDQKSYLLWLERERALNSSQKRLESGEGEDNDVSYSSGVSSSRPMPSYDMTQLALLPEDRTSTSTSFPEGITDVNGQQVDLRRHNSWTMRLHEVSTPELAEVFAINSIAPTIINARLKNLMQKDMTALKFIVNVSAMEGKFYRFKSDAHPHTNMAKAALNMMTRTSAQDYVKSKIYMTAVDTGWINDEKPIELAVKHEQRHNFQTPIDELDAASRVLDPIISPLLAISKGEFVEPPFGVFLKDYVQCEW